MASYLCCSWWWAGTSEIAGNAPASVVAYITQAYIAPVVGFVRTVSMCTVERLTIAAVGLS